MSTRSISMLRQATRRIGGALPCFIFLLIGVQQQTLAVTREELMLKYDAAQAGIVEAVYPYRWNNPDEAIAILKGVTELLAEAQTDLQDPALTADLGNKYRSLVSKTAAAIKAITQTMTYIEPAAGTKPKTAAAVISKLMDAGKAVKSIGEIVAKPLLSKDIHAGLLDDIMIVTEPFTRKDFWDKPNQIVKYKLYPPGWPTVTTFDTPPTVTIYNTFGTVVDPNYIFWDAEKNILTLRMGPNEGVARFEVTYQGTTKKHLMSCRGPSGSTSMPVGVSGLLSGEYLMTCSGTATGWALNPATGQVISYTMTIPPGSFPTKTVLLKNPKTFLNDMIKEANAIASGILAENGAKGGMSLVSVDESGFTIAVTVEMGTPSEGGRATIYITVTRL